MPVSADAAGLAGCSACWEPRPVRLWPREWGPGAGGGVFGQLRPGECQGGAWSRGRSSECGLYLVHAGAQQPG